MLLPASTVLGGPHHHWFDSCRARHGAVMGCPAGLEGEAGIEGGRAGDYGLGMAEYFYSVARMDSPETAGEFGWQVMRHDGKEVIAASRVYLSSAEARAEAERLIAETGSDDA